MQIWLTYDLRSEYLEMGFTDEETAEFDSEETINSLEETISSLGHSAVRVGNIYELTRRLSAGERCDLALNISEGLYGRNREAQVPALLEAYNIPYTFSDPLTLSLCLDKAMAKRLAKYSGVPTPDFLTVNSSEELEGMRRFNLKFPLFTKPISEGTGKGINDESIVNNAETFQRQCTKLLAKYNQPVLVERYLHGREFTAGIIGTGRTSSVIGVMEVIPLRKDIPHVYSFMNKELWEDRIKYELVKDKNILKDASAIALRIYRILGCRDAGRVDLRSDGDGKIFFLEVNPLAGLHPTHSDLPILCSLAGLPYKELISRIIASAVERQKKAYIREPIPQVLR